ncbi:MAG: DnaJ domain-containing protein [Epsilonproteobacteria bacterium]|jgi:DnaJ-class molecular chaperone|nr:DnaJ domain-containing protein [Campylobacterota bacterium]
MDDRVNRIKKALKTLELAPFVSIKEIKDRYREMSKKYHPDICGDEEKMSLINEAYEVLKEYTERFRFSFDEEEINKQYPENYHADRFRF